MLEYKLKPIFVFIYFVISLMVISGPAVAMELKIATLAPEGSPWMQKMRQGAETIAAETAERVRFKFFPGGIMGNDKAVLRKIRIGQLHGGVLTGGSLSKAFSDAQVYSLPLKFRSLEEIDYVRKQMDEMLLDGYEKGGFVTFGLAEGGFAYLMSKTPVRRIDELGHRKVWIPDHDLTTSKAMNGFGIKPIPLPMADVRSSLQTGLIDTVTVSPIGAIILQWHTQIKFLTELPLLYVFGTLAVDRKAFAKISPEDQKMVRRIMGRTWQEIDQQNRSDNNEALKVLNNLGIEFVKPAPDDENDWFAVAAGVTRQLVDSGIVSKEMVSILDGHLKVYRSQRSETQ